MTNVIKNCLDTFSLLFLKERNGKLPSVIISVKCKDVVFNCFRHIICTCLIYLATGIIIIVINNHSNNFVCVVHELLINNTNNRENKVTKAFTDYYSINIKS